MFAEGGFRISEKKGLVLVYTGNGKGKTTAALGLALRAVGHSARVFMVQFRKDDPAYGEIQAIQKFLPNFTVVQTGRSQMLIRGYLMQDDISDALDGFNQGKAAVESGLYDLVIFDEINVAMDYGLVPVQDVLKMIADRPRHLDIVLTGRNAPREILNVADLISEVREVRHHYNAGVKARAGIEY